ncbi:hypothetical protein J2Z48_001570 [Croceifilum oryzae]|uniref:Uncharacterized protein n=1 Tax=Croceifilum oryzae TaxID=1553429 RepID=A0AAJ1TI69_9BACL|nr:hypothetical protein [Croceifilum oryzae]MDQ0417397.1 hypothetical protein [Croceifilum oryzae]
MQKRVSVYDRIVNVYDGVKFRIRDINRPYLLVGIVITCVTLMVLSAATLILDSLEELLRIFITYFCTVIGSLVAYFTLKRQEWNTFKTRYFEQSSVIDAFLDETAILEEYYELRRFVWTNVKWDSKRDDWRAKTVIKMMEDFKITLDTHLPSIRVFDDRKRVEKINKLRRRLSIKMNCYNDVFDELRGQENNLEACSLVAITGISGCFQHAIDIRENIQVHKYTIDAEYGVKSESFWYRL